MFEFFREEGAFFFVARNLLMGAFFCSQNGADWRRRGEIGRLDHEKEQRRNINPNTEGDGRVPQLGVLWE